METRNLTCIGCPLGCALAAEIEHGEVINVTGNTCRRGDDYARKEVTHPARTVTSTVRVTGGDIPIGTGQTPHGNSKGKKKDI